MLTVKLIRHLGVRVLGQPEGVLLPQLKVSRGVTPEKKKKMY